jgi:hypothetical protein
VLGKLLGIKPAPKVLEFTEIMRAETAKNSLMSARDLLDNLGASDKEKLYLLEYFIDGINGTVINYEQVFDGKHVILINEENQFLVEDIKNHE